MKISREDEKYLEMYGEDPNFDPEKNKRVIESTIRKNDARRRAKEREYRLTLEERTEGVARFLKNDKTTDAQAYFGNQQLAYLRGEEIMAQLKEKTKLLGKDNLVKEVN